MKRLSLEELKAQKVSVVANLDAISGGNASDCHCGVCEAAQKTAKAQGSQSNGLVNLMVTAICFLERIF